MKPVDIVLRRTVITGVAGFWIYTRYIYQAKFKPKIVVYIGKI